MAAVLSAAITGGAQLTGTMIKASWEQHSSEKALEGPREMMRSRELRLRELVRHNLAIEEGLRFLCSGGQALGLQ